MAGGPGDALHAAALSPDRSANGRRLSGADRARQHDHRLRELPGRRRVPLAVPHRLSHPERGFGRTERATWETLPALRGLRELFERALAAYDWGESFVAINLVAKPAADETLRQLGRAARRFGDTLLSLLAENQLRDAERSRRWSAALVRFSLQHEPNAAVIRGWLDKWTPLAARAMERYCEALPEAGEPEAALSSLKAFHRGLDLEA